MNVEERRLTKVSKDMPEVLEPLLDELQAFEKQVSGFKNIKQLVSATPMYSNSLWQAATKNIKSDQQMDDRPLYWMRLAFRKILKNNEAYQSLEKKWQDRLLNYLELSSRGFDDLSFKTDADYKILVTGFDPFFLDRNLDQSNPSGVAVMWLDGKVIELEGKTAEVQAVVFPVRYEDFNFGIVENNLSSYFTEVDMLATISMGRVDFDLERFPGLRRSAKAPDNLNVYTGASKESPIVPMLRGEPLVGPEFVEFSLPVAAMQAAKGKFKVIDNHKVTTLADGDIEPKTLRELNNATAVAGSGGGYLSNEISYRTVRLRNQLKPDLPVGHIHTPRIKAFEPETSRHIALQIEEMLRLSLKTL